jgi:hypothetical protein
VGEKGRSSVSEQRVHESVRTSLDNLPKVDQRREVEPDNIHLQLGAIGVLDHGAYDGIPDFDMVKVHAGFATRFEHTFWFLGWHARECMTGEG